MVGNRVGCSRKKYKVGESLGLGARKFEYYSLSYKCCETMGKLFKSLWVSVSSSAEIKTIKYYSKYLYESQKQKTFSSDKTACIYIR